LNTHGKTNKQKKSRAPQTLLWKWYVNRTMRSQPGSWATRLDDEPPSTQIIASPVLYLALAELLWRYRPCGNQSQGWCVSFLLLARGSVLACFVFFSLDTIARFNPVAERQECQKPWAFVVKLFSFFPFFFGWEQTRMSRCL
jgi:hypothetical protein